MPAKHRTWDRSGLMVGLGSCEAENRWGWRIGQTQKSRRGDLFSLKKEFACHSVILMVIGGMHIPCRRSVWVCY